MKAGERKTNVPVLESKAQANASGKRSNGGDRVAAALASSPMLTAQRKQLQSMVTPVKQRKENKTGMPDRLKSGIEGLSGMAMDDVKVHYNSPEPAAVNAHAYAQGNNIHMGRGQEKHLPHEAWHVVQQRQGRVTPTTSMNGMAINDNPSLEKEADSMGAKALQMKPDSDRADSDRADSKKKA